MISAERQRLHRANLSDVQRVNNRNRDSAYRILARAELSEVGIEDIYSNLGSRTLFSNFLKYHRRPRTPLIQYTQ